MPDQREFLLAALAQAMERERQAWAFYRGAAEQVADLRGQDLLRQLADFENHHYEGLRAQHQALSSGQALPSYAAREMQPGLEGGFGGREARHLETALEVLTAAIQAEEAARSRYEEWAAQTEMPAAQELFRRLAHEEGVHARILNDEFYSLSNRGIWLWGD